MKTVPGWIGLAMCATALSGAGAAHALEAWIGVSQRLAPLGASVDFTPHGSQPQSLFYDFNSSLDCSGCHGGAGTAATYRPYPTWAGSMMANATRDPVFFAALDIANHDVPGVGDYCLRCHTSRGWYRGHVVKGAFGNPDNDVTLGASACLLDGAYDRDDDLDGDYGGVACHFCHRLTDTGPNGEPAMIGNGNAWIDDEPCTPDASEPCRRGPYTADGSGHPHERAYSAYHTQSANCGLCHDVSTPDTSNGPLKTLKLADGTDTGHPFPIERTFSEWQQSQYAQTPQTTCQNCHMPGTDEQGAMACVGGEDRTGNLPIHEFAGGNAWVPGIIKGEYSDTSSIDGSNGGIGREASFDQTVAAARRMLAGAASVATTITGYTAPGSAAGALGVQVKVTNLSGHKLPTGYGEGRRMWLNLQVRDAQGALVFESAAYDAASAVLTKDTQARVYEVLQGIWNHRGTGQCDVDDASGAPMFHFALNDCVAKDNRIPPLGFKPATASDPNGYDLRPVGATYAETAPGSGVLVNYDTADYNVALPVGAAGPFTATATLYYQTSSREYVEFLRDEAAANAIPGENAMCAAGPGRPFVVGPKERTRGQYLHDLWSDPVPGERIFGDGFDGVAPPSGYGKSPPETMTSAAASTPS